MSGLDGADGGLGAVGYSKLGEDAPHLRLYGAHAEEQVLGDLGVGLPLAQVASILRPPSA